MEPKSPYTFNKTADNNIEVFNNGQRVSTGTEAAASAYGYTPSATDVRSKYGITTPTPSYIGTSDSVRAGEQKVSTGITNDLTSLQQTMASQPTLDQIIANIKTAGDSERDRQLNEQTALKSEEDANQKSINDQYNIESQKLEKNQQNETGATTAGLARMGGYLGGSASQSGVLTNLAYTHQLEVNDLQQKRSAALQAARNADSQKQRDLAKQLYQTSVDLEKRIQDRTTAFYDQAHQLLQDQLATSKDKRDTIKSGEDTIKAKQDQFKSVSENIAPVIFNEFDGKLDSEEANAFIESTAKEYGFDANQLKGAVQEYSVTQNLNKLKEYTPDIKNYMQAKSEGYTGKFADWQLREANLKAKAAGAVAGAGLPPDDPIFFAALGIPSPTIQKAVIDQYKAIKATGNDAAANKYVDTVIYQGLPVSQKTEFDRWSNVDTAATRALNGLATFKDSNMNVWNSAIQQRLPLVNLKRDPKWTKTVSDLALANAEMIHNLYGSAVTETEKAYANRFAADPGQDDLTSLVTKTQGLIDYSQQLRRQTFASGRGNFVDTGAGGGEETVSVVSPTGVPGKLPKSKVDAALKKGYKLK